MNARLSDGWRKEEHESLNQLLEDPDMNCSYEQLESLWQLLGGLRRPPEAASASRQTLLVGSKRQVS